MTTLRFLLILLAVLNVLAFAAIKGWLGGAAPHGEPERISNQLRPEQIRLIAAGEDTPPAEGAAEAGAAPPSPPEERPAAAETPPATAADPAPAPGPEPAPPAEAPAPPAAAAASCMAWAELTAEEADRLAARLNAAGIKHQRSRKDTPSSWWVRTPPQGSRAQAEKRVQELREQGVTDTFIVQDGGPSQFAVSLGLFRTENSAQLLLSQLRAKGVRDATTEPRMTASFRIQANLPPERVGAIEGRRSVLSGRRTACRQ